MTDLIRIKEGDYSNVKSGDYVFLPDSRQDLVFGRVKRVEPNQIVYEYEGKERTTIGSEEFLRVNKYGELEILTTRICRIPVEELARSSPQKPTIPSWSSHCPSFHQPS